MNNEIQIQVQHFANLKSKYQATKFEDSSASSLLYLILRKADLGIEITDIEGNWLLEHDLLATIETIEQEQQLRAQELSKLKKESEQLLSKYKANKYNSPSSSMELLQKLKEQHLSYHLSPLIPILWKVESGNKLTTSEMSILKFHGLTETIVIVEEMGRFASLKEKYQATKHQDSSPDSPLYKIFNQLELEARLSDSEINWLKTHQLWETLAIFQQQEAVKEAEFTQLKDKYQANKHPDSSASSPLYPILQKLDVEKQLNNSEINWLKVHKLVETMEIVQEQQQKREFVSLKAKYKATQYEDSSPSSHLYKVLTRIDSGNQLGEQDLNFLKKRKLTDTITIALDKYAATLKSKIESGKQLEELEINWLKENGREQIITFAQEKHFVTLKSKYDVSAYKHKSPSNPLYAILQKLDKGERLEPTDVAWLEQNKTEKPSYSFYEWPDARRYEGHQLFSGKIFTTYHQIEATFYEQEYQRTGNKWNLPNASSHWRKAYQPRQALKLTDNLDLDKIKENKLKSAILTTRGGAFRDIKELDKAEKCARQAIDYQPNSHHPYTLMGAICYERGQYSEGDYWFAEAIKHGASPRDQDAEIKRVVKNTKDENKRREVVEYLLKKDPQRYAWTNSYLKKSQPKVK